MEDHRQEFAGNLRRLPLDERKRRLREILDRVQQEGPTPDLHGKTAEEVVRMVKRTREEMWKDGLAPRS